jgi:hypothetical protein
MTEGEFKKRFKDAFFELPKDSARNKVHAFYMQTKGLIAIDEAEKELFVFLKKYVTSGRSLDENWLLDQYDKWTTKWFGETPYEQWLDDLL